MRPKKKASMKGIADSVGVSVNTVSQALSNKSGVNKKTRDLILETAEKMGYEYENGTRSAANGSKTGTVGLIITDNANPFFAHVVRGVQNTLWQHKYSLILCNTNEEYSRERGAIETLLEKEVDGIILTPTQAQDQDILNLVSTKVPFVVMGRRFANFKIPNVLFDDRQGAYKAIDHLIRLGHSRILFINAPKYISSAEERYEGYLASFADNGIKPDASLVRICEPSMEAAYNEMKSILLEKLDFSAVFTFSDLMMLGVVKMFQEMGIRVPEDYSLVGFDDIDFVSLLTPALTTVCSDKYKLGVKSANMLLSIIHGDQLLEDTVIIPTKLIIRGSTRKLG
jgi:LacI family transcriptional regulator